MPQLRISAGASMSGFLATLIDSYQERLERQRRLPFLRACMAACATIAIADGEVSFPERVRVDQILETLEALQIFDPHDGVNLFNEFVDAIRDNPRAGRESAMAAMLDVADDPESADLLVRVCCAVSEADGEKHLTDQIEIVSLCSRLGIEPRNLGLYAEMSSDAVLKVPAAPPRRGPVEES
jgi:tellurite resistance protein TerB